MGSSAWLEFSAYEPDPLAALTRIHQEVFAAERYFDRVAYLAAQQPYQLRRSLRSEQPARARSRHPAFCHQYTRCAAVPVWRDSRA